MIGIKIFWGDYLSAIMLEITAKQCFKHYYPSIPWSFKLGTRLIKIKVAMWTQSVCMFSYPNSYENVSKQF